MQCLISSLWEKICIYERETLGWWRDLSLSLSLSLSHTFPYFLISSSISLTYFFSYHSYMFLFICYFLIPQFFPHFLFLFAFLPHLFTIFLTTHHYSSSSSFPFLLLYLPFIIYSLINLPSIHTFPFPSLNKKQKMRVMVVVVVVVVVVCGGIGVCLTFSSPPEKLTSPHPLLTTTVSPFSFIQPLRHAEMSGAPTHPGNWGVVCTSSCSPHHHHHHHNYKWWYISPYNSTTLLNVL